MFHELKEYERNAEEEESDVKMEDIGYSVLRKEMPINPWVYEEMRREDGSLMTARIYTRDDARECFICEDEAMLTQMMRDFWTSVGRRDIKCE